MTTTIQTWHDTTSDPDRPVWCVSICDEDGEVSCLSIHDTEDAADEAAERESSERGIPLDTSGLHLIA